MPLQLFLIFSRSQWESQIWLGFLFSLDVNWNCELVCNIMRKKLLSDPIYKIIINYLIVSHENICSNAMLVNTIAPAAMHQQRPLKYVTAFWSTKLRFRLTDNLSLGLCYIKYIQHITNPLQGIYLEWNHGNYIPWCFIIMIQEEWKNHNVFM